jgi:voltage-gated potassium channel
MMIRIGEDRKRLLLWLARSLLWVTIGMVVFGLLLGEDGLAVTLLLLLFILLFALRWIYADDRKSYLKANWIDLALIILLTSPLLRLLVVLKIAGWIPMDRVHRIFHFSRKQLLKLLVLSKDSLPTAMALVLGVVVVFGSLTYLIEHGVNPAFGALDDGLWWAFVTITTVGYGDIVPMTGAGRFIGVIAMVIGVLIYSLVIANVTRLVEMAGDSRDSGSRSSDDQGDE